MKKNTKKTKQIPTANTMIIKGKINRKRLSSRVLEEQIQNAVKKGARELLIVADGQHGIGGRLWPTGEKTSITVEGPVGQRLGSMSMNGDRNRCQGRFI